MIEREALAQLYENEFLSVSVIAGKLKCSENKVNYWLCKHGIKKRSISDAIYRKWNPKGDPFSVRVPSTVAEGVLYGLGIGLYWGEGTKANKGSVRLGNSSPALLKKFIQFLIKLCGVDARRLRFGLQIFGDMRKEAAIRHWVTALGVSREQFFPGVIVTPHRGVGNYRKKTKYGVLTVYFGNKKLRDILCNAIEEMAKSKPM